MFMHKREILQTISLDIFAQSSPYESHLADL